MDRVARSQYYQTHLSGLTPLQRHTQLVQQALQQQPGDVSVQQPSVGGLNATGVETDYDALKKHHRFLRAPEDDASANANSWGARLARRYYARLFKEYAIADLSRYKEAKIGLRWRTQSEVVTGKGQFTCGAKGCEGTLGLCAYEVNFAYQEDGKAKQALVKLCLCEDCAQRLNYRRDKDKQYRRLGSSSVFDQQQQQVLSRRQEREQEREQERKHRQEREQERKRRRKAEEDRGQQRGSRRSSREVAGLQDEPQQRSQQQHERQGLPQVPTSRSLDAGPEGLQHDRRDAGRRRSCSRSRSRSREGRSPGGREACIGADRATRQHDERQGCLLGRQLKGGQGVSQLRDAGETMSLQGGRGQQQQQGPQPHEGSLRPPRDSNAEQQAVQRLHSCQPAPQGDLAGKAGCRTGGTLAWPGEQQGTAYAAATAAEAAAAAAAEHGASGGSAGASADDRWQLEHCPSGGADAGSRAPAAVTAATMEVAAAVAGPAAVADDRWALEDGELNDADIEQWLNSLFTAV